MPKKKKDLEMDKKVTAVIALLALALPTVMVGMNEKEQTPEQEQIKNSEIIHEFTKKLIGCFKSRKVLQQIQEMRKKFVRSTQEVKNPCPICQEELEKYPCITLHKAEGGIPHNFHVHCLYHWILSSNKATKIPLYTAIDPKEVAELGCPLCQERDNSKPPLKTDEEDKTKITYPLKIFSINKAELQQKYLEYLKNNPMSLEERLSTGLARLPFDLALKTIEKYQQLDTNDKASIEAKIDNFNDKIQQFLLSDSFFAYKKTDAEQAKKTFKLLSENIPDTNTYFDLLVLHWDLLNQEQRRAYFKETFRQNNPYAHTWRSCNSERLTQVGQLLILKSNLGSNRDNNLLLQTLDDIVFSNLLLVAICANDLPSNLQNYCLEAILVDNKDNKTARKYALGLFRANLNKQLLDEFYKKYLAKIPLEKQMEDVGYYPEDVALQVLEKYAKLSPEDQKILCKNDDSPGTLVQKFVFKQFLGKYGDLDIKEPSKKEIELANVAFKLADKESTIFIQFAVIMAACLDSNKLVDCFEKALKKAVSIVPDKELFNDSDDDNSDDNDDMPNFEKAMSHKNDPAIQELIKNTSTIEERKKKWQEYSDYLKIAELTIRCLAKLPVDKQKFYLKKIIGIAPAKTIKLEMEYKIFSALSPEVRIKCFDEYYPKFTDNRKSKTLIRLKKQLLHNKKPEEIKQLIIALKNNNGEIDVDELMLAFGTKQERFSAFCNVLKKKPKATYYITDVFKEQCASLTEHERQCYLDKMVEFVDWYELPRELRNEAVEKILHDATQKNVVYTKKLMPFQKSSICTPLAVSGMLCSLSDRLKKI